MYNERNHVDIQNIHKGLINQFFYYRVPGQEEYYKKVYISWNPYLNAPQVHEYEAIKGDPDPALKSISAGQIGQLRMQTQRARGIC